MIRQAVIICAVVLYANDVLSQRFRFQKYRYDPWTGRTTSVEEFDEDVRNMDSKQLERYMKELQRVKSGMEEMRRESDILERELGFGLGGFPSLMDNSENIIDHALNSVTDQLQRRIGYSDPKMLEKQRRFDDKVRSADRPTLQRNLDRLQQTKREIEDARQRAEALKNELGFEIDRTALERAESAVKHGMDVINHRIQKLDHPHTSHPQVGNANVNNTMRKVENAVQTADPQRLTKFDNEFKKMKQYMDNVKSQLDNFHRDIGFELDSVFEPFKMAENVLEHGLNAINRQLNNQQYAPQNQPGGPQQYQQQQQGPQQYQQQQQGPQQYQQQQQGPQQGQQQQQYPSGGQQPPQGAQPNQQNPTSTPQQPNYGQQNPSGAPPQH